MILWTYLVAMLAVVMYLGTGYLCGHMRAKHRIAAPAMTGHPEFERAVRVQENTLEMLVPFLPSLIFFGMTVNPLVAAILGAIWIVGRILFAIGYMKEPAKRGLGFMISFVALAILVIGAIAGLVTGLIRIM